jgi:cysteine desulfurase
MAARAYLDAGGAAPLSPRVADALRKGFEQGWADPGRLASESRTARLLLTGATEAVAEVLGARPEWIHWTPSPHFAFERAFAGIAAARRGRQRIVVSAVERDALVAAAEFAAPHGLDTVPVSAAGHVDLEALRTTLSVPDVAIVAVQHANQELGTIQRIGDVAHIAAGAEVPLVVDATASIGHVTPPSLWDALVAHPADWGGPSGLGLVALRPQTRWLARWPELGAAGADGWAPGGVSVPLVLAAAVALQEREENRAEESARLSALVDRIRGTVALMEGIDVQGDPVERLPHVLTFSCLYADGEALVSRLNREGFAVGSGSACATGTLEPSRVLAAVGALTHGNVRIALHPAITEEDVERFLAVLPQVLADVRTQAGARGRPQQ